MAIVGVISCRDKGQQAGNIESQGADIDARSADIDQSRRVTRKSGCNNNAGACDKKRCDHNKASSSANNCPSLCRIDAGASNSKAPGRDNSPRAPDIEPRASGLPLRCHGLEPSAM
ncbi:hypothetical protein [Zoogloea ramigera]|uniref:hypothetical protein n=1 Tax=Zoogloea ramigera TaxID=350 RepID=UPI003FA28719